MQCDFHLGELCFIQRLQDSPCTQEICLAAAEDGGARLRRRENARVRWLGGSFASLRPERYFYIDVRHARKP